MRRPIIAGNWKMNKTPAEAEELVKALVPLVVDAEAEVVVCPPFVCLDAVGKVIKGTNIKLGAQNVHFEKSGAFTGEISADMLLAMGVEYVIIGHSERRQYFGETDCTVNKRARAALAAGLKPIICVGESLAERENGITDELVGMQTKLALKEIEAEQLEQLVIAYEPIWAIGTGKTATAQEANATIGAIRRAIAQVYGEEAAQKVRIQYGGSMNPKNASELMAQSEIDGGLIGGASLKAEDFSKVVKY
ncbi:MAG: triose-phosphate isomerase [Clostridiales bacterium]|nr:MAG: triose-phosphate isomerase [Clostridiales bacterium]